MYYNGGWVRSLDDTADLQDGLSAAFRYALTHFLGHCGDFEHCNDARYPAFYGFGIDALKIDWHCCQGPMAG